jgi:hypothetical protein
MRVDPSARKKKSAEVSSAPAIKINSCEFVWTVAAEWTRTSTDHTLAVSDRRESFDSLQMSANFPFA